VRRFLADALQRFGGSLEPAKGKNGVFTLSAGTLKPKLQDLAAGDEFPIAITFDRRKDDEALYLGRTQPLVARVCDAVLGEAFSPQGDERFARAGAMFTDAVATWTALTLLRFRSPLFQAKLHRIRSRSDLQGQSLQRVCPVLSPGSCHTPAAQRGRCA
jgi:hypothetical protein